MPLSRGLSPQARAATPDAHDPATAELVATIRTELSALDREIEQAVGVVIDVAAALSGTERQAEALNLMEAGQLHDIGGQRLSKVRRLLNALVDPEKGPQEASSADSQRRRALLLNGPAPFGPEVSQSQIDTLFE